MEKQTLWSKNFVKMCFSSFFLFLTYYALVAALPLFIMESLQGKEEQIGLALTSFIIAAVLVRPFAGNWLDQFGRKKIFVIFSALFMVFTFLYMGISSLVFLLVLRFLHGISFGVGTTAMAAIAADLVPDQRKGEGIGYYALFMNLAMVIGPFIGLTALHRFSFPVLAGILSVFSILSFVLGLLSKVPQARSVQSVRETRSFSWTHFIEPKAVPTSLTAGLLSFAYSGLLTFVPVYAQEMGYGEMSSYFFVIYALMIVLSRPFTGRLFDRMSEHVVIYPSIVLYGIGLILLSMAHTPAMFLIASGVIGLGFGAVFPSFQAIAIKSSPAEKSGVATGTFFLLLDLGMGVGSFILGMVAAQTNYSSMYFLSSVIVAAAGITYYCLYHRRQINRKKDRDSHFQPAELQQKG